MSKETRLVILSIIGTLVVVGVLQNMRTVTIRFILWEMGVPLSLFLLFVVGLGFIAGLFWRRR
ncbi:MAG: LapA family protein [Opitutaceae bacterium]|nr:LapA family protein [Opitutaceae bacterium]